MSIDQSTVTEAVAWPSGDVLPPQHQDEMERMAEALMLKYEELTLIHQLSERLIVGEATDVVCDSLLSELGPCIQAETLVIELFGDEEGRFEGHLYQYGHRVDQEWIRHVSSTASQQDELDSRRIVICNSGISSNSSLRVVVVPIDCQGENLGQMVAIRNETASEFGTVEAELMKSTSMMLGAHLINQRQYRELQEMFEGTIQSLVSALDAKDTYTCGHSSRVSSLSVALAETLGFDEERIATIRMAGILHDIGKIGIDDSVLRKPGRLTDEEFEQIKQHPVLGYEILKGIRQFRKILPAVRHHHESWDGTGYPDGLVGESIPRDAQVLAVADSYDAMTSDRPYRSGMPIERVIEIFKKGRGRQWAADVVDALFQLPEIQGKEPSASDHG